MGKAMLACQLPRIPPGFEYLNGRLARDALSAARLDALANFWLQWSDAGDPSLMVDEYEMDWWTEDNLQGHEVAAHMAMSPSKWQEILHFHIDQLVSLILIPPPSTIYYPSLQPMEDHDSLQPLADDLPDSHVTSVSLFHLKIMNSALEESRGETIAMGRRLAEMTKALDAYP